MELKEFTYFYPERPVLSLIDQDLIESLSGKSNWIAEKKYNGQNCMIHNAGENFEFWGRHGTKLKYQPSESMQDEFLKLNLPLGYNIIHGELRHNKVEGIKEKMVLYDVFVWDGKLLSKEPYWARRARLIDLVGRVGEDSQDLFVIEQFNENFQGLYDCLYGQGEIEGLVLKNVQGTLNLSRKACQKSKWMFKCRFADFNYQDSRAGSQQLTGALQR